MNHQQEDTPSKSPVLAASTTTSATSDGLVSVANVDPNAEVRQLATPAEFQPTDETPSEPQVITEPWSSANSPYSKRKRHPSDKTDSVTPSAKLKPPPTTSDHTLCDSIRAPHSRPSVSLPKNNSFLARPDNTSNSPTLKTKHPKSVSFQEPLVTLINDLLPLSLQPEAPEESMRPWAVVENDEIDPDVSLDHDFGPACRVTWTLIQDHLILAEKCLGRATLAHNSRISSRFSDWSLGLTKIPALMLPASHRQGYFDLVKTQATDKLRYLENILNEESTLCTRVAAIHTETLTKCLETEDDKQLFPQLRNKVSKLARSRAAAYGKRVFDSVGKQPATFAEIEEALVEPLPHQEFHPVAPARRHRSRSPLPSRAPRSRSRSPRPRPLAQYQQQKHPRAPTGNHSRNNRQTNGQRAKQPNNNSYAPQRRPVYGPPAGRTNSNQNRCAPTNTATSSSQLSADELAGLRALLKNNSHHGGR